MEYDLGLVQFLLDLHNAVGLARILVLGDIFLELGQRAGVFAEGGVGPRRARVFGEELVDDLGKQLMRHESRIVTVGDDDTGHTFGPAVCVECV